MKANSLITVATLALLSAGAASAQSAWGSDPAYAPMHELGASTLTREEVRAELSAARAEGRLMHGGEIATPGSVLVAMAAHERALALAAAPTQPEVQAHNAMQGATAMAVALVNKMPQEVMPVSTDAAAPAVADPYRATTATVLFVEMDERGEPVVVEVVELDVD